MKSYNWGEMMVRYAAGGDIAGVNKALASGSQSVANHAGEAYWVAAGKGHRSIMALIESKYNISDGDRSIARNRAKAFGHTKCVDHVDKSVIKSYVSNGSGQTITVNIRIKK